MDPVFFICMPVFNSENYLENCLKSIINQSYLNFHLILVDDGSTDSSGTICNYYSSIDKRITALHQKNGGAIRARNTAIKFAKKQYTEKETYIIFVDSDDTLKENALELLAKNISLNNFPDMVLYGADKISKSGVFIERYDESKYFKGFVNNRKSILVTVTAKNKPNYCSLWGKATKIELFDVDHYSSYLLNMKFGEDAIQSFELFCKCNTALFLGESLYNYRINPSSIMHTINPIKGIEDIITGNTYIAKIIRSTGELSEDELQFFINDASSKLLSMLSTLMISRSVSKKQKIALLEKINSNLPCKEEILMKQNNHMSITLINEAKYIKAYNCIRIWSIGQFFKFAYIKSSKAFKANFKK